MSPCHCRYSAEGPRSGRQGQPDRCALEGAVVPPVLELLADPAVTSSRKAPCQPRVHGRLEETADFWRLWIQGALRYPWVWLWNEGEAASVWIPPGGTEMSTAQEEELDKLATSRLGDGGAAHLAQVMAQFDATHPHGEPHYYLSLLATHPAHRGRGAGMALLADNLARIDDEGMPAYLESSNPANDHRYKRMGFQPVGQFGLPDHGPVVTTMWRAKRDA